MTRKIRLVIDTTVWLSALLYGGTPAEIVELFVGGSLLVVTSEELLSELRRKIQQKFPLFTSHLNILEASIRKDAILVKLGTHTVKVSRDSDDDKVIETAFIGNCSYIVSGDKDLLSLKSHENIQIMKPADFLQHFSNEKVS